MADPRVLGALRILLQLARSTPGVSCFVINTRYAFAGLGSPVRIFSCSRWVLCVATKDVEALHGPFNCGWHLILFCKSLLWLLDFLSSKLNKGIFSIITVSKQTTGVSAFRRGCGVGPRVERYCCNSVFDLGGSLWTWVASWNEAGRCCWQGSGEEQYPAEPFPASVPA